MLMLAAALPLVWIGARIGDLVATRINQHTFNVVVGAVLMLSGAILVFK